MKKTRDALIFAVIMTLLFATAVQVSRAFWYEQSAISIEEQDSG